MCLFIGHWWDVPKRGSGETLGEAKAGNPGSAAGVGRVCESSPSRPGPSLSLFSQPPPGFSGIAFQLRRSPLNDENASITLRIPTTTQPENASCREAPGRSAADRAPKTIRLGEVEDVGAQGAAPRHGRWPQWAGGALCPGSWPRWIERQGTLTRKQREDRGELLGSRGWVVPGREG